MAPLEELDMLSIRIVEDAPDSAVFVVQVHCGDPQLLTFWLHKAFFHNGQVQQTDTLMLEGSDGLEFVLRVLNRSRYLPNSHYWSSFVVALCLDALIFRYHLPPELPWNGNIQQVMLENTLTLTRSKGPSNLRLYT